MELKLRYTISLDLPYSGHEAGMSSLVVVPLLELCEIYIRWCI